MDKLGGVEGTQVDLLVQQIRQDIVTGQRAPGERLRIERMRELYGSGPTPIREALQRLVPSGFVIALGNRGFQVAPLDGDDFIDLNIARIEIEMSALRLSIEKGDDDWEARVVAAAYALRKEDELLASDRSHSLSRWESLNSRFHAASVEACGSRWLLRQRALVQAQCDRYRSISVLHENTERNLLEEHQMIADAVIERDIAKACQRVRDHYNRTADGLLKVLKTKIF